MDMLANSCRAALAVNTSNVVYMMLSIVVKAPARIKGGIFRTRHQHIPVAFS
jgi:hypothetical protein